MMKWHQSLLFSGVAMDSCFIKARILAMHVLQGFLKVGHRTRWWNSGISSDCHCRGVGGTRHFVYICSDLQLKPLPLKGTIICIKYILKRDKIDIYP